MVERCAPTINQARAACGMVAWSACVAMRYGRAACGALWSRYLVALWSCPAMAAWLWLLSVYDLKRRTTNAHAFACMGACLCCVLIPDYGRTVIFAPNVYDCLPCLAIHHSNASVWRKPATLLSVRHLIGTCCGFHPSCVFRHDQECVKFLTHCSIPSLCGSGSAISAGSTRDSAPLRDGCSCNRCKS